MKYHLSLSVVSRQALIWLNASIRNTVALALIFTPSMVSAGEQHLSQQRAQLSTQRTQVYTLDVSESTSSVAQKFRLSQDQLRKLNQFRVFSRGFDHLQAGDEIDVPVAPQPEVNWGDVSPSMVAKGNNFNRTHNIAGYAFQAGSFLKSGAGHDAAATMARGSATSYGGGALQQWLSKYGTARVQIDADKNFSLKNSQFDLLMPLYDQGDDLVFTQGSWHKTDGRTQANLGVGLRHFTPTYMLGGSLFGDYDLSRDHARTGAGLEYWRCFLKLGVNGYIRLTDWKDSPNLTNYQERPANGWDVRAQAWLPSLPQLGGKLQYEQYYGMEVALFGVDNRQKNPHAITSGINYTPVPLITLGVEQRQGQSGRGDTRLTVDINYQLGQPWRNQVDPAAVAAKRSLIGSRYDLVDRNNNIVLEYRKKEVIRLHTVGLVAGRPGERKSLGVSVISTYGLSHVDWDAKALSAAGGKIVQSGTDYAVVLPPYQSSAQAVNTYAVSGVAVDTKGNRSDRSDTQVTVQAPDVNKQATTFTPASSELAADGKSTQELTLTLRDENNQAVDIAIQDINLKNNTLKSASVSALTRKSAGVYTVTVTAGTGNEKVTLTPSIRGVSLSQARVTISNTTPDSDQSQLSASPDTIMADNTATSTLTLVVKDTQGSVLTGLKDNLSFVITDGYGKTPASGVITESAITEGNVKGTYTWTLKGNTADKYTVVPEFKGTAMGNLSAIVTLTAATPAQVKSAIKTDTSTYFTGSDMTVTVTLKDAQNNAVTKASSLLTAETVMVANATLKSGGKWQETGEASGIYTATYTAETASTNNHAQLKLSGWSTAKLSQKYTIKGAEEPPLSIKTHINAYTFDVSSKEGKFPTTGFQGATFTIVPKDNKSASDYSWTSDASWVSVSNGVVTFTGKGSGDKITITGTPTNGQGKIILYKFKLTGWFITNGDRALAWSDASAYCSSQSGYSLPKIAQLTNDTWRGGSSHNQSRALGNLWSEWGNLTSYPGAGLSGYRYWSSESNGSGGFYIVGLYNGDTNSRNGTFTDSVLCRKEL